MFHPDKEYLKLCLVKIREVCDSELHLNLSEKTQIFPLNNGVNYFGWHFYLNDTGKVVRKLRNSNKKSLKRRMKRMAKDYHDWEIDFDAIKRSMESTYGHLMHGNTYRLRNKLAWETVYTHGDSD